MATDRYVGILMKKRKIVEGISIYFPDHVVCGKIIDDYPSSFIDEYGQEFLIMNNSINQFEEDEVGYLKTEKDLLGEYNAISIEEAINSYINDMNGTCCIGVSHSKSGQVIFLNLNVENLFCYFNNLSIDEISNNTSFNKSAIASLLLDAEIFIEENKDENISSQSSLDMNNSTTSAKESLEQLMPTSHKKLDAKNIELIEKIDGTCNTILKINDIAKLKRLASGLENLYAELVYDKYEHRNSDQDTMIGEFLYKIMNKYRSIVEMDDINEIKNQIKKVRDFQKEHLLESANKEFKAENENQNDKDIEEKTEFLFNPKKMKQFLDERIIDQEQAKKDVISAIFMNSLSDEAISKNTCLLVGPTGSGKTLIVESIADYLKLPIVNIDATQLTIPGFVGASLEDFLVKLVESTNGNIEEAERGIVIFDELDKKGSENNSDVSGKGVLNTLLPFIQGTTYTLTYNKRKIPFDTSNLTIFMTGAFTDVARGVSDNLRYNNTKVGFNTSNDEPNMEDVTYKKLNVEDFVKYGNFPIELIGRISTITQLNGHTKESLKKILTDSNISVLKLEQKKLKKLDVELKYDEDYLDAVALKAMQLGTGARSLKATVEDSIKEANWEVMINPGEYSAIILNKDAVDDNEKAIVVQKDGNYSTVLELRDSNSIKSNYQKVK